MNSNDTQQAYSNFHQILTTIYNEEFPIQKKKLGYDNKLTWLTEGLKRSIITKHKLHHIYLNKNTQENRTKYTVFKNKLNLILRITERQFYQSELSKYQNNM